MSSSSGARSAGGSDAGEEAGSLRERTVDAPESSLLPHVDREANVARDPEEENAPTTTPSHIALERHAEPLASEFLAAADVRLAAIKARRLQSSIPHEAASNSASCR